MSGQFRRARWLLAGAAVAIAGLLATVLPAAAATGAQTAAPGGPAVPVLNWQPCPGEAGFECATAQVPLDYQQPHGQLITLAVIMHPATDPARRIGSLFYNPGGPADAGTTALPVEYPLLPAAVRQRFDIISWDPRGVGNSTAVQCFPSQAAEADFFTDLPAGFPVGPAQQATWISLFAQFAQRCEQDNATLLAHISTADTARDLNLLRQAVGDPVLNYLGVSYGTYLGATYANLFPGKVGAMVLDGNVDPIGWTTPRQADGIPLSTSLRIRTELGAAATMGQFLSLCGQAPVTGCAFSAGTAAATEAKYARLLEYLRARPVTTSIPAFGKTTPAAPATTFTYAFTVSFITQILQVVQPVANLAPGWAYGAFVLQTLWNLARTGGGEAKPVQPAPPTVALEQAYAILCADSPNPENPADYRAEADLASAQVGPVAQYIAWQDEPCSGWQATDADGYFGPWNQPTAHTLLLIGNTYDPNTPYQDSLIMASQLADARLLTLDGYGHTALNNPSTCIQDYEASYFISGTLPPPGTTCQPDQQPFSAGNP